MTTRVKDQIRAARKIAKETVAGVEKIVDPTVRRVTREVKAKLKSAKKRIRRAARKTLDAAADGLDKTAKKM